jgi:carbonic anhydrase/acetyltransferase-like protein (isoleucine patch superfamily)
MHIEPVDYMILASNCATPVIDTSARIAPSAVISGDAHIGPNCSIGHGAVVVAEGGPIRLAANCIVMDTAVLRGVPGQRLSLGKNVMVGPRSYLVGCVVEDDVFLATGATVFNGAFIGRGCEVRINGIVHIRTRLPEGTTVPIGWVAVGDPASILPPDRHEEIWAIQRALDFPKYVLNAERAGPGENIMPRTMARYAAALGRMHRDDVVICREEGPACGTT